jgi:hypothetical protein
MYGCGGDCPGSNCGYWVSSEKRHLIYFDSNTKYVYASDLDLVWYVVPGDVEQTGRNVYYGIIGPDYNLRVDQIMEGSWRFNK